MCHQAHDVLPLFAGEPSNHLTFAFVHMLRMHVMKGAVVQQHGGASGRGRQGQCDASFFWLIEQRAHTLMKMVATVVSMRGCNGQRYLR